MLDVRCWMFDLFVHRPHVDKSASHYYSRLIVLEFQDRKDVCVMAEGILEIEDSSFDTEVLQSEKPVLVDFWAPWCGPCKAIGPIIEELASTYGDQVKFTKCNVDDNPVTPGKYGIRAIPTLIFFKGGNVADQITGMVAKSKLEESISNIL
jgi:thioredoxin 1